MQEGTGLAPAKPQQPFEGVWMTDSEARVGVSAPTARNASFRVYLEQ